MHDMTASDMLRDPLVRQMLHADKISLPDFASFLDSASRKQAQYALPPGGSTAADGATRGRASN